MIGIVEPRTMLRERTIKMGLYGIASGGAAIFLSISFCLSMPLFANGLRETIASMARFGDPVGNIVGGGLVVVVASGIAIAIACASEIRREIAEMCGRS